MRPIGTSAVGFLWAWRMQSIRGNWSLLPEYAMTYDPLYLYYPSRRGHSNVFKLIVDALRVEVVWKRSFNEISVSAKLRHKKTACTHTNKGAGCFSYVNHTSIHAFR